MPPTCRRSLSMSNCTAGAARWESHQRTVFLIQRPHQHGLSAVEPTTAVPLFDRILVAGSLSAIGSERHCDGQGAVPNHPAQTAQDWRTGAHHRTQSLAVVLQRLPGPGAVRPCLSATPVLTPAAVQLFDNSFAILSIIPRSSASALSTLLASLPLLHDFVPQPLYHQHCRHLFVRRSG